MLIFDAHLDLAWNGVEWNRNLELPVAEIRKFEQQFEGVVPGDCTVSYPELTRGDIGVVIATLLSRKHHKDKPLTFYQTEEAAHAASRGQLAYYRTLVNKGVLRPLRDAAALTAHVAEWKAAIAAGSGRPPIGYILSMEGAWPILSPGEVQEWYELGLQILGPAHYGPNKYCYGTGSEGGFSAEGRELLKAMSRVGMLMDATHLADQSFWDAMEVYDGPVLASHHNCRSLVPGDRQLNDDQIKALIERGSVIGAAFDNWMLKPGWKKYETSPDSVSMEQVADHIDHVCQLAGNTRHSGIGTDLDGGFGKEQSPGDMDTIADIQKLAGILERRGYSAGDIEGIMHGNFVRFFEQALRA
jgi:membrane dipeptidase